MLDPPPWMLPMSFDEPVAFALTLYLDFVNLFMMLLQFFGNRRD